MSEAMEHRNAVETIKTAILQSQYQAAKGSNAVQLRLYYAVGGYVSANTREGRWGTGAIDAISEQLQKELPGLQGFAARNPRLMRTFYEEWSLILSDVAERDGLGMTSEGDARSWWARKMEFANSKFGEQPVRGRFSECGVHSSPLDSHDG